ncbi:PilZ domain-containing protein [Cardiobacterium valvarum]|uniref:Type 4 fimbrial biogenesis protein PilZ family protein n=1 Tax=Cardiobacterium valvarum F0432 TaxID=797473 RepID=G9ZEN4_9GAMM|nr:PilZ domain-containing protein [Cardiobacterium valvarum]EHM54503.1 type 4 fimbrial biogenesis protein PilZ family protein [Cardiobacterium valvarum F0432]
MSEPAPATQGQSKLKQGVIKINIDDLKDLYQYYMPYVDGCGIFVPTEETYNLEQEVFIFLKLPGDLGKFAASGRIVWLNPPKKASRRMPGVGVQLRGKEAPRIREIIEAGLGKSLASGLPTATM